MLQNNIRKNSVIVKTIWNVWFGRSTRAKLQTVGMLLLAQLLSVRIYRITLRQTIKRCSITRAQPNLDGTMRLAERRLCVCVMV